MRVSFRNAWMGEWFRLRRRRFCWIAIAGTACVGFLGSVLPRIEEKVIAVQQQVGGGQAGAAAGNAFVYFSTGMKSVAILAGLFIALAASGAIAGEAASGTLRVALTRPVGRARLFIAKFTALAVFLELLFFWGLVGALAGAALVGEFGPAVRVIVKSTFGDLVETSIFAVALSQLALAGVLCLSLLASTVARNASSANAVSIGFLVLCAMLVFGFEAARPYVFPAFTTSPFDTLRLHALGQDAPRPVWFGIPTLQDWADVTFAVVLPAASALLAMGLAMRIFTTRDWLT